MLKTLLLILIIISHACLAADSDDFVIKVQTNFLGVTGADQFKIPTLASLTYNYDVDCNDDTINEAVGVTGDYICDYSSLGGVGIYTIRIKLTAGTGFPRIYFNGLGDKNKIISVEQWGKNKWASMNSAFEGAINLTTTATDSPDLSNASSLAEMFKDATSVNPNTTNWNTSTITSFTGMFQGATSANPDVSQWNTGLVQRFKYMFDGASSANPDTSLWDSSSVLFMEYMFRNATSANPNLTNWNIENVTSIQGMFEGVTLPTWDYDALLFGFDQQNLNTGLNFDGGNSKYCYQVGHDSIQSALSHNWTVADAGLDSTCPNATDDFVITIKSDNSGDSADDAFKIHTRASLNYKYNVDCNDDGIIEVFNQSGNYTCDYSATGIGNYTIRIKDNTGNMTGFPGFGLVGASAPENQDKIIALEQWGTMKWLNMEDTFRRADNMIINAVDNPNFSLVTKMGFMFAGADLANPNTTNWDTSLVNDMQYMFTSAAMSNPDTSNWNIEMVENMTNMFLGVALPTIDYDAMLIGFSQQNVNSNVVFHAGNSKYCSVIAQQARTTLENDYNWTITDAGLCDANDPAHDFVFVVKTDNPGTSDDDKYKIEIDSFDYSYNFNVDCNDDGIDEVTGEDSDYTCNYSPSGLNLGAGTYTIRIKDNTGTNNGFPKIRPGVATGASEVNDAEKIIELKQWGTNQWQSASRMFADSIDMVVTAQDIPDFSNTTSMFKMFHNCNNANPDTLYWDVSQVENMGLLFYGANSANPDVSRWNTGSVKSMSSMFHNTDSANPDVSLWDTSEVLSMQSMFQNADVAMPDTSGWDTSKVTNMLFMFFSGLDFFPNTDSWNITQVTTMNRMFKFNDLTPEQYDAILINFGGQNVKQNVAFHGGDNNQFCSTAAKNARANLINNFNWVITDNGSDPTCVNQDPTISGLPADITVTEDVPSPLDLSMVTLIDTDIGVNEFTLVIQTHSANLATLTAVSSGDIDIINTPANTLTLIGRISEMNDYLSNPNAITFTGALNNNGNDADLITLTANDGGNTGTGGGTDIQLGTVNLDITAVNDEPTITGLPTDITLTEDTAGSIDLSAAIFADVDSGATDIELKITASSGTLTANSNGLVVVTGSSSTEITLVGSQADINTYITNPSNIGYLGTQDNNGNNAATLSFTANDGGNSGAGGGTDVDLGMINLDITAVNDDPTATGIPNNIIVVGGIASNLDLSTVIFSDVDASLSDDIKVIISSSDQGSDNLSAQSSAIIVVQSNGYNIKLTGTMNEINNYLSIPNNMSYTADISQTGDDVDTIAVVVNDQGNTGVGGGNFIQVGAISIDVSYTEIIFKDGFESSFILFKAKEKSFKYDFSKRDINTLTTKPMLIAKGLDDEGQLVIKIYLRQYNEQLQIHMRQLNKDGRWTVFDWQNIENKKLTVINW